MDYLLLDPTAIKLTLDPSDGAFSCRIEVFRHRPAEEDPAVGADGMAWHIHPEYLLGREPLPLAKARNQDVILGGKRYLVTRITGPWQIGQTGGHVAWLILRSRSGSTIPPEGVNNA